MKHAVRLWWVGQVASILIGIAVGIKSDSSAFGLFSYAVLVILVDIRFYLQALTFEQP